MPSVSPVLHTQDTSQTRDCRTYTNYVHWQIILMYHWTTWWEETGNRKKITKGGTLQSNHSRNVYKVRDGNRIKAEEKTLSEEGVFFYVSKEKTFTGYVLLRENTVCGIIMEV